MRCRTYLQEFGIHTQGLETGVPPNQGTTLEDDRH